MKSSVLNIEECCAWCRKPAALCAISCDDAGTYSGVLIQGQWRDLEAPLCAQESGPSVQTLTAA